MTKGKILAYIALPLCFLWMVQTLMWFWADIQIWKDPQTHGMFFVTALIWLAVRNIPTLIVLYCCTRVFGD